jgi:4-phospho-D-threonate 3-dehydrogenase / 4-phospho-D-erythronate 3-dehydrogenase
MTRKISPIIGITLGDPSGIGPEITLKYLAQNRNNDFRLLVIGHRDIIKEAIKHHDSSLSLNEICSLEPRHFRSRSINYWHVDYKGSASYRPGRPDKNSGLMAISFIDQALDLAINKKISAIVTNPVSKNIIVKAGIHGFIGHTEYMAKYTRTKSFNMIFAGAHGIVGLVTTHISLREVPRHITKANIIFSLKNVVSHSSRLIKEKPCCAVLGLNPHAGENGMFGKEEIHSIIPAIKKCKNDGFQIDGPFPADSFWARVWPTKKYNIVLAMYHDQGLIPVKTGILGQSVNITIGLPVVRTSVDHGTAFDIAGKGIADISGLKEAINFARKSI